MQIISESQRILKAGSTQVLAMEAAVTPTQPMWGMGEMRTPVISLETLLLVDHRFIR
jgi:hypothetical protein